MSGTNGTAPTAAAEWGKAAVETVDLPSGERAKLRKTLHMWVLARRGVIGQDMLDAFTKAADGVLDDIDMAVALNDVILEQMFVDPPVFVPSDDDQAPPEGSVHIDQIDDVDAAFVLERAFRGAREAAAFREQSGGAAGGGDGKGVGNNAKQSAGPRGRRGGRVPAGQAASGKARSRAAAKPASS